MDLEEVRIDRQRGVEGRIMVSVNAVLITSLDYSTLTWIDGGSGVQSKIEALQRQLLLQRKKRTVMETSNEVAKVCVLNDARRLGVLVIIVCFPRGCSVLRRQWRRR